MAVATRDFGLFIGGETREGARRELSEPATGQPFGTVALASAEDVDAAVEAARAALPGWARTPPSERSRLLHALADALHGARKELAELEARNTGKALGSAKAELAQAVETFRFYASIVGAATGETRPLGGSLLGYTLREPVGVVGQIVPWNYPLMLAAWKLAPALAAGCACVLKPDPATPATALRLAELATEAGFPPGTVNVVPGDGPATGAALVAHEGVDKIAFTGSTATGAEIMRGAASPLKRLILELGGKSPNLVFADADLADAVPSSVWAIAYSAGQSCEARSRVLVQQDVYDAFVEAFVEACGRVRVGDPLDAETQMGSLISGTHREKVHRFVEEAVAEGGELLCGGTVPDGPGAFYPVTVVATGNGSVIAQEEVFGPVAVVVPFADEKEAVALANDSKYGLMATVWTGDGARAQRLARGLRAGTVGLNTPYSAFPGLPFGGFKQSGFGRELGASGLDAYLEEKTVLVSASAKPFNPFGL
ncbi:MAG: betaine-aldehyde dehydrogenase [Gaiellaceae bacterium]|nr:betaine-aldehyde dehydrogenase [Gaiellaceae bacterium]